MNNLMKFENKNVEVFEYKGNALFNPRDVGNVLGLDSRAVEKQLERMNKNKIVKLTNSDTTNKGIRKLNNKGERFITESGVYKMIFSSRVEAAERFQDWVTDEVLPQIRRTGTYTAISELKGQEKMFRLLEGKVESIVNDAVREMEEKCSQFYRPASKEKSNISTYIKSRLGISKANEEYELVKQRVLIKLNAEKWEDIPVETLVNSLNIVDESIKVIKSDRRENQISFFSAVDEVACSRY
ncbi:BRO family protein [Clostridium sp.]|uniref:BRO-N domain-containing protein n=1 Tax=Clostridium sp. TaxID=1506 RepID=UPI003217E65B